MANSQPPAQAQFPDIKIPSGIEPWMLGQKELWGELDTAIKPLEGFRVTSAAAEAHLAKTRRIFDNSKGSRGWGIIHNMVGNLGGDNGALLAKLLALGLHPDLEINTYGLRPSHLCSVCARPMCAQVISLCRPNLRTKDEYKHTPLKAARQSYRAGLIKADKGKIHRSEVARVWEATEQYGFLSIAEMASQKLWFGVQNLCRRRIFCPFTEGSVQHQGKTAVEWAVHFGESSLADELRYFLEANHEISEMKSRLECVQKTVQDERDGLASVIDSAVQSKMDVMREEFVLLLAKQSEETEKLRETLEKKLGEKEAELHKLRRTCDKLTKRQKELEDDVEDLEAALEKAQKPGADEMAHANPQRLPKRRGDGWT